MDKQASCDGGTGPNMVFSCSGAADVGEITDLAARGLQRERHAAMCCSAAIAAGATEIVAKAREVRGIVAIDGCDVACVQKILTGAGFEDFAWFSLDELGMDKGKSPATEERVAAVLERARECLPA